ncbi:MAG TPA: hypothetical protein PK079_03830 [Leptospiraceae bacterium]|nr:hypothetical protein [Leptospiraceae bacterium]HMW03579.1 hypothetical protein [Leptospiraceae bacterium]HMX32320.1 hypothetical protein [Leptospiraceae bacterium]HMY29500.1 hypothetical protein [Leptospiraceae bacterium]HMZ63579.1 hypothetical protein [Leptospiraceae bacterium]
MIPSSDLKEINSFLKGLNGSNAPFDIYVDNLHSPYVLLREEYLLPPISNMDFTKKDILPFLKVISKYIPEAMVGCSVLPIQKPKRETGKISLVREISLRGHNYLYIFKIDAAYLGGSAKDKIISAASQVSHPSFSTDRIYFSTKIVPIKNVIRADGEIIDFEVQTFDKGLFITELEETIDDRPKKYSELFDEIDYSPVMEPIKLNLKIMHPNWSLGKIYEPVYIEYLTLSVRFLLASYANTIKHFSHFYEILEIIHINGSISEITRRNFIYWLSKHSFERGTSPSGNMRWKILQDQI